MIVFSIFSFSTTGSHFLNFHSINNRLLYDLFTGKLLINFLLVNFYLIQVFANLSGLRFAGAALYLHFTSPSEPGSSALGALKLLLQFV